VGAIAVIARVICLRAAESNDVQRRAQAGEHAVEHKSSAVVRGQPGPDSGWHRGQK